MPIDLLSKVETTIYKLGTIFVVTFSKITSILYFGKEKCMIFNKTYF